ncbi:unnamed protein product [Rangifer tarandus platyrhynchus]|uniref:Uncharacterized protein n=1 Tax=Rangifer tarandus platyrhynchus TaxID=3082113 RepID=A0AC59Z521_RANTA
MGFSRQENVAGPPYNMPVFSISLVRLYPGLLYPQIQPTALKIMWYSCIYCWGKSASQVDLHSRNPSCSRVNCIYLSFLIIEKLKKKREIPYFVFYYNFCPAYSPSLSPHMRI